MAPQPIQVPQGGRGMAPGRGVARGGARYPSPKATQPSPRVGRPVSPSATNRRPLTPQQIQQMRMQAQAAQAGRQQLPGPYNPTPQPRQPPPRVDAAQTVPSQMQQYRPQPTPTGGRATQPRPVASYPPNRFPPPVGRGAPQPGSLEPRPETASQNGAKQDPNQPGVP
eukprot:NODE_521_length_871_cov_279.233957_g513_i0.p2 GENE.NODE_521_length_871_cov_279.233957_g513_i0~~NODE_521_length_871_cov_279.233957_g513_i0.p2  ORF type:complete len:168 (-),score=8.28 NODE_521_length_871_cov_279.233957_g513_i0:155-658(-)